MKKILVLCMLFATGVSFGQKPKDMPVKQKAQKEIKKNMSSKKEKEDHPGNDQKGKKEEKEHEKGEHHSEHQAHQKDHPEMNGKEKEHPGKGHAYGKNKGDLSGREFGMTRAGKTVDGTKIKNDDDAKEIIREVKEENQMVITEVKSKIDQAADILIKKKEAGEISDEEYIVKSAALELLKKKEEDLKKRILGGN